MQLLLPLDKYEVEMAPNGVFYVYSHGYIKKKQDLLNLYKIVEAITEKIGNYASLEKRVQQSETSPLSNVQTT
jgi:hypothetical protein